MLQTPSINRTDPLAVKHLYDEAFTSVNPSNVSHVFGNRFPQPYPIPWRASITNTFPNHYPDVTAISGLPGGIYPIPMALDSRENLIQIAVPDAPFGQVLNPMTTRYQDMPTNPNAVVIPKGGIMSDDTK
jgi:hypothetical protein